MNEWNEYIYIYTDKTTLRVIRRLGGGGGGITRNHTESHGITWNHTESHGITRNHMESHGIRRNHMESHGIAFHLTNVKWTPEVRQNTRRDRKTREEGAATREDAARPAQAPTCNHETRIDPGDAPQRFRNM